MFDLWFGSASKKRARSESGESEDSDVSAAAVQQHQESSSSPEKNVQAGRNRKEKNTEVGSPVQTHSKQQVTPKKVVKSPLKSSKKNVLADYRNFPARNENIFEERVTLAQKLAKAVPDAEINSPHVIIVGGQTAGKTKLIISLVFYHLIDNKDFTDDMGLQLLKIFRTGKNMATRRPTTITFSKADQCKVTINLDQRSAIYPSQEFHDIVEQIARQSKDTDGRAYEEELTVYISAPHLPNRTFTDLPGLITKDRQLSVFDGQTSTHMHHAGNKSIATMVMDYMKNPTTTVVVVEPASVEDFETSQISPLLRDIRLHHRPDIFDHSVLVLSKCDKIRDGLEGDIMEKIDLTSSQLREFPYRHVVGVINRIEGEEERDDLSYPAFKELFRRTKQYEREHFAGFFNKDLSPCNPNTQCTTSAVFNKMEAISFTMVYRSIQDGILSLDGKIAEVEEEVKLTLAPSLEFYDHNAGKVTTAVSTAGVDASSAESLSQTSVTGGGGSGGGGDGISPQHTHSTTRRNRSSSSRGNDTHTATANNSSSSTSGNTTVDIVPDVDANNSNSSDGDGDDVLHPTRMTFIDEFRAHFDAYLEHTYESLEVFPRPAMREAYIRDTLEGWPKHRANSIEVSKVHRAGLRNIEDLYHRYVEQTLRDCAVGIIEGSGDCSADGQGGGCLSRAVSPFHRVDRFPVLCKKIRSTVTKALANCVKATKTKISNYIAHQWDNAAPSGISLSDLHTLLDALHHLSIRTMHEKLTEVLDKKSCFALEDSLFVESPDFASVRKRLQDRPFQLRRQRDLLRLCLGVRSNDELREALERSAASSASSAAITVVRNSNSNSVSHDADRDLMAVDGSQSTTSATASSTLSTAQPLSFVANDDSVGADEYWREFWKLAALEAAERERAEAEALQAAERAEREEEEERLRVAQQVAMTTTDETADRRGSFSEQHTVDHNTAPAAHAVNAAADDNLMLSDDDMIRAADAALASQESMDASSYLGTPNNQKFYQHQHEQQYQQSPASKDNNNGSNSNSYKPVTGRSPAASTSSYLPPASAGFSGGVYTSYADVSSRSPQSAGWQQIPGTVTSPSASHIRESGVPSSKRTKRDDSSDSAGGGGGSGGGIHSPMLSRLYNTVFGISSNTATTTGSHTAADNTGYAVGTTNTSTTIETNPAKSSSSHITAKKSIPVRSNSHNSSNTNSSSNANALGVHASPRNSASAMMTSPTASYTLPSPSPSLVIPAVVDLTQSQEEEEPDYTFSDDEDNAGATDGNRNHSLAGQKLEDDEEEEEEEDDFLNHSRHQVKSEAAATVASGTGTNTVLGVSPSKRFSTLEFKGNFAS